jgi:hypothetical protein
MSNVKKVKTLAAAFAVLFLMDSCAEFFSTSWGEIFKRDPKNVKVTASNVYDLLDVAKGDPELSKAILDQINADSNDTLKRAAIKAANQAVGISTVALENIKDLIDAVDSRDKEGDLKAVANHIQDDLRSQDIDIVDIANKMVEILVDDRVVPPDTLSSALENARTITVPVRTNNGRPGAITIAVNDHGESTATITVDDVFVEEYPCVINDDGTIILIGAREGGGSVVIEYAIDDEDRTLTLTTGLNEIKDAGLANISSGPSVEPIPYGRPEFTDGFANSVPESDLTLLAMTLILAKAEKERNKAGDLNAYLATWSNKNLDTGRGLDKDEVLIVAIINEMVGRGEDTSELANMIKDLLGVK